MSQNFTITSPTLPEYPDWNVKLSNSFVGHRLHSDTVFMNGLYNGYKTSCHRARIPCPMPYVGGKTTSYMLDMKNATYTITGEDFEQRFYAHAVFNRVFVTEITVRNDKTVNLVDHHGDPSSDLVVISDNVSAEKNVREFHAKIKAPETDNSDVLEVFVISSNLEKSLGSGNYVSICAFGYTHDEASKFFELAMVALGSSTLRQLHETVWSHIWSTVSLHVDNTNLALNINSALFYLLSAFPTFCLHMHGVPSYPFNFFGVSPGGLGNGGDGQDYWGHVFWDQDLWMLPSVMLLFPELVRQSILYRIAMLPGARNKAHSNGYTGAMYPWESARTGIDVCPGEIYAKYQQHVTADVVYAIRQYVYITGSWDIIVEDGAWDVVKETADFWVSRVKWDGQCFVINGVMDPDEYHYNVNNSCFTNAAAKMNLRFAVEAAMKQGITPDRRWTMLTDTEYGIKIPFDGVERYHPEYDGYTIGTKVKQASVVLLGYPLMYKMDDDVRRNDIIIYERSTAKGPAMTYSMYTIGMLELGDLKTAESLFKVQFQNITQPFLIWNEYATAYGCTNFLTGIGGFLQSLYFGYLGVRVFGEYFLVTPHIIPDCNKVTYRGLQFHGERFNFEITSFDFIVTRVTGHAFEVWYAKSLKDGTKHPLITNQPVQLPMGSYEISLADD